MNSLILAFFAILFYVFLAASAGRQALSAIGIEFDQTSEDILCSIAIGAILLQLLFFSAQFTGHIRVGLVCGLLLTIIFSFRSFGRVWKWAAEIHERTVGRPKIQNYSLGALLLVLMLDFVAATAPLTASDALHYHFAAPLLALREGLHPNLFLSHSLFCGEGHSLILFGLALGSERIATGLLFLGGALAAASTYVLAQKLMSGSWPSIVVLTFVLTPLVAWQISSAGAPDLWMTFFTTTAVLVISNERDSTSWRLAVVGGVLAGGIAGIKYTGCYATAALAVAFLVETHSFPRTGLFGISALVSGVWPYLRNWFWTGDPVFPFLLPRLNPLGVNSYAMNFYMLDTGAAAHHDASRLLRFITFSWIDPARVGFWQFFGPLIVAFLPFLVLAVRNKPIWRVILIVWAGTAVGLGLTSGMARFLLVVYPIALIGVFAGIQSVFERQWKLHRLLIIVALGFFLAGSAGGFLTYVTPALAVSLGFSSKDSYLRDTAPDYQVADFVNQSLQHQTDGEKVLVFFRHVYFLRIPFVYGDPRSSWAVDPSRLQTTTAWKTFFQENSIRWVVRSPNYPPALTDALESMEREGVLKPIAQTIVEGFRGKRSLGIRERLSVIILRVNLPQSIGSQDRLGNSVQEK